MRVRVGWPLEADTENLPEFVDVPDDVKPEDVMTHLEERFEQEPRGWVQVEAGAE